MFTCYYFLFAITIHAYNLLQLTFQSPCFILNEDKVSVYEQSTKKADFKYLQCKKMAVTSVGSPKSRTCCCVNVSPQQASRAVGVADIILGGLGIAFFAFTLTVSFIERQQYSDADHTKYYPLLNTQVMKFAREWLMRIPIWLQILMTVCHGIQIIMGVFLFIVARWRRKRLLELWLGVTGLTAIFTGVLIRIYELWVVSEFSDQISAEKKLAKASTASTSQPPTILSEQPGVSGETFQFPISNSFNVNASKENELTE